jgi:hypothetical protein
MLYRGAASVGVTILVEFIVNLYVLPFGYEFVLVFLVIVFAAAEADARALPGGHLGDPGW